MRLSTTLMPPHVEQRVACFAFHYFTSTCKSKPKEHPSLTRPTVHGNDSLVAQVQKERRNQRGGDKKLIIHAVQQNRAFVTP